jgi:hypothetical protein
MSCRLWHVLVFLEIAGFDRAAILDLRFECRGSMWSGAIVWFGSAGSVLR